MTSMIPQEIRALFKSPDTSNHHLGWQLLVGLGYDEERFIREVLNDKDWWDFYFSKSKGLSKEELVYKTTIFSNIYLTYITWSRTSLKSRKKVYYKTFIMKEGFKEVVSEEEIIEFLVNKLKTHTNGSSSQ